MSESILIVGASLGGLRAAEQLRAAGWTGGLSLIGDEPHLPYNRPPLSKEALAGGVEHADLAFRHRPSIADATWVLGQAATGADLQARTVTLADGQVLPYAGLVAASGLRLRRLDPSVCAGLPEAGAGRHGIRTLEDAAALRSDLVPGARVVILGAGFIGCEVAATAIGLGCTVTVVAPESVPMLRPLGEVVGAAMQRRHEAAGVAFRMGTLPTGLVASDSGDRVAGVLLNDGTHLPADVVVEALGCLPNVEWLQGTGADLSDGVLCDGNLRVLLNGEPLSEVVAVGDVARFPNALFGGVPRRVEHWNIPGETAKRAAATLVAGLQGTPLPETAFAPMPAFWSDQYGVRLQSFGSLVGADGVTLIEGDLDGEFAVTYASNGQVTGVVGAGLMPTLMKVRAQIAASANG